MHPRKRLQFAGDAIRRRTENGVDPGLQPIENVGDLQSGSGAAATRTSESSHSVKITRTTWSSVPSPAESSPSTRIEVPGLELVGNLVGGAAGPAAGGEEAEREHQHAAARDDQPAEPSRLDETRLQRPGQPGVEHGPDDRDP